MSSYRTAPPNELFIDQFSVFEEDGYSKKTGLDVSTDFDVILMRDCVESAIEVVLSEIGSTGEYQVSFTPDENGFYDLEIHCLWNHEIWAVSIEVSLRVVGPSIIEA